MLSQTRSAPRFTPRCASCRGDLVGLGRPLSDFARKFTDPDLDGDARAVLEKLVPVEREIVATSGRWFQRRITPYRTADDRIDGVVIAFLDITPRVEAAARLAETARLLDLTNDAIIVRDVKNRVTHWNRGAEEMYGYSAAEAVGQELHRLLRTDFELPLEELMPSAPGARPHDRRGRAGDPDGRGSRCCAAGV